MKPNIRPKVFDFFSGCGGTSHGLASAGMEIVFGLDFDADSAKTFMQNIRPTMFIENDIRKVSVEILKPLFDGLEGPTVFSGCAPCQPFSSRTGRSKKPIPGATCCASFGALSKDGCRIMSSSRMFPACNGSVHTMGRLHDSRSPLLQRATHTWSTYYQRSDMGYPKSASD